MLSVIPMLLGAAAAFAGATDDVDPGGAGEPSYLSIEYHQGAGAEVAYTVVYDSALEARRAAERAALCGFWVTNLTTLETFLVAPGAVEAVHMVRPQEPAPLGGPPVPPPDVEHIVDCPRARQLAP
jgi:hypothetical protein